MEMTVHIFNVSSQEDTVRLRSTSVTPIPVSTVAHVRTWWETTSACVLQVCMDKAGASKHLLSCLWQQTIFRAEDLHIRHSQGISCCGSVYIFCSVIDS